MVVFVHYLTVAVRSFMRERLHTVASVAVLALGILCFTAAYLVVSYLHNYDRHFVNADRTLVIFQALRSSRFGLDYPSVPASATLLGPQLALDVPELESVARYRRGGNIRMALAGESRPFNVSYAEPSFLNIFDFKVVAGNLAGALSGRNAIVTTSAAERLFGGGDAVGKTIVAEGKSEAVTIAAVIEDLPRASHLSNSGLGASGFELLLPWEFGQTLSPLIGSDSWFNTQVFTYALLPREGGITRADLDRRLAALVNAHVPDAGIEVRFAARPISTIAASFIQAQFQGFQGVAWRVDVFTALLLAATAILLVSCLNFVNLATARATGSAREVGVRKAVGAKVAQVVLQQLVRTALLVLFAVVLALSALCLVRPAVADSWQLGLALPWHEPRLWAFLLTLVVSVTGVAGCYPAFVAARFEPSAVLRTASSPLAAKAVRWLLVGSQFFAASLLVALVCVLLTQRETLRERLLGRFSDQYVIVMHHPFQADGLDADVISRELSSGPGIVGVTDSFGMPWQFVGSRPQLRHTADMNELGVSVEQNLVGHDYFSVMDVPVIAGRAFSRDRNDASMSPAEAAARTEPLPIVLDRKAARALGWVEPATAIGQTVYGSWGGQNGAEVIGVVETMPISVRERSSAGVVYVLNPSFSQATIVRIDVQKVAESLAYIDRVFQRLLPIGSPQSRMFLDEAFDNVYAAFAAVNRVFVALSILAIAIAGLGLFGMASYMTARRTREIGLRKSQGASSTQVLCLLLSDFSKPVVVANLLAWPVAYGVAVRYLDLFAERMVLTAVPFLIALVVTVLVAGLAVATRVVRAASMSPAEALRHE